MAAIYAFLMQTIVYWFRNDLRLHDNEGVTAALANARVVLPVFVFDPRWFDRHPRLGFRKTGVFRAKFLLDSVADLRQSFRNRGADLLIRVGNPADVLAELIRQTGAEAVYTSQEVTAEETLDEVQLSALLEPLGVGLTRFWMSTLYHLNDLPAPPSQLPDVFSDFRRSVQKKATVRPPFPAPEQFPALPGLDPGSLPSLTELGFSPDEQQAVLVPDPRRAMPFAGGETAALNHLNNYIWETDRVATYKQTRNEMLGSEYSSKLSAWLSLGCLSPRYVCAEVMRYEQERTKNESTYWLIFELIWRDFFRFVALKFGNRLFSLGGMLPNPAKTFRPDELLFWRWANGQTGVPFVDANMRELNASGFMSNRGRQNAASFLVNDLLVDWRWGAAYFESLLIDYDPCSNWGNWSYVAGVGNDPRADRYFNIRTQAIRYDPDGDYIRQWLPVLASAPTEYLHYPVTQDGEQQDLNTLVPGEIYPSPMIDPTKWVR